MCRTIILLSLVFLMVEALTAHADTTPHQVEKSFDAKMGCLLVIEIQSGKTVAEFNPEFCRERLYPCSTFKVPLAVMGFDSGILKDEKTTYKWDRSPQLIKDWEKDHNARSWLKESVVWYSQRITSQLGLGKVLGYLKEFHYGNEDFSGGLTKAWLSSSLKISAREQVELLRGFKLGRFKINPEATRKMLSILPVVTDEQEFRIIGKTGSGFSWEDPVLKESKDPYKVGWYIGYLSRNSKEYAFAVVFKDKSEKGKYEFGGLVARNIAKEALKSIE